MTNPSTIAGPTSAAGRVELLQRLIRFDTTNPPGNEGECLRYLHGLLTEFGLETELLGPTGNRPNLVARLKGTGAAPPLLLYGHVDVVTTEDQEWTYPPFEGRVADGFVWGRGSLDMKGGIVMMLSALLRANCESAAPPGDIVLALVSDEEAGGHQGARFLVENHSEYFEGVRHAIGEFGGFSFQIGGRRFYPVMVAEKQACWLRLRVKGQSGHGSLSHQPGAMARLSSVLKRLEERQLPVHVTPDSRRMIRAIASELPIPASMVFRSMLHPMLTGPVLKLLGGRGRAFSPLLHNTVTATMVSGGRQINVTPGEVVLDLDGRLLPGFSADDVVAEVREIIGEDVGAEVVRFEPGPVDTDLSLFPLIEEVLRRVDPEGVAIPMLLPGATDARHFARLGIQTYGFLPMRLPTGLNFSELVHGPDERIPLDSVAFGAEAIYQLICRGGQSSPAQS